MTQAVDSPIFNIKAVIQETGIAADTLRAWERRYGLPRPQRTPGGHRLYSRRDIELVRWLVARQREGLTISSAVEMWHRLREQGGEPLATRGAPGGLAQIDGPGQMLDGLREQWLAACRNFDEAQADDVLAQAFALYPPEMVCLRLLRAGLAQLGEEWYQARATVQQEHFASELAMRHLERMMAVLPPAAGPVRLIVAAPPEEEHVFPLLTLAVLLRRRGWGLLYLGARGPLENLEATLRATGARMVVSGAQQLVTAARLLELGDTLAGLGVRLAYAGGVFVRQPSLVARIQGHYLGDELEGAPLAVEQALSGPPAPPRAETTERYRQALAHFRRQRSAVEAELWQRLGERAPAGYLAIANYYLAANIEAALALGDPGLVAGELAWISGLLQRHGHNPELLSHFLGQYRQALALALPADLVADLSLARG
jgi:DNA-binding transcriptional MerR regulator